MPRVHPAEPVRLRVDEIRNLFNGMAEEYDHLRDLWYRHTFGFIDRILRTEFAPAPTALRPAALDVGCGTGIQSLRLAALGYRVSGVDISDKLLAKAREKLARAGHADVEFHLANAEVLPIQSESMDVATCCGPALGFVPDWRRALSEIARCLKPGGKLLLEVDGKWNFDLLWELVNALGFNFLRYDQPVREALRHLLTPFGQGYLTSYSFKLESGDSLPMPLRVFTGIEIKRNLRTVGLLPQRRWALHALTNLIPSTVLHRADPSPFLARLFATLAALERPLAARWPVNRIGCSQLFLARKQP